MIFGLIAILGGVAFWWWRLKNIKEATDEITDVASRAWGKYKRHKFRKKVEDSPVEAVDDAVAAAVIMMLAMAKEAGPVTDKVEAAARREIVESMKIDDHTELLTFSKWVTTHVQDANNVSLRYAKLWGAALSLPERNAFLGMVERVAAAEGALSPVQKMKLSKLQERLGLAN